jgi:hypothetical protein
MKTYRDFCREVGLDNLVPPKSIIKYYAYKDGKAIVCDTRESAHTISRIVEVFCVNKDEIDAHFKLSRDLARLAFDKWYEQLRLKYENLSDEIFGLCYSYAYEDGHAYGHDEVANYMPKYVDFYKAIKCLQEE